MESMPVPQIADGLFMSLKNFEGVHVRLPVLDKAIVISRNHPVVVVAPLHGSHCCIVRLFKLERDVGISNRNE